MAKKSRTPPPPRRPVQAPQRRAGKDGRATDRRTLLWLVILAALGLVGLAVAIALIAFGGDKKSSGTNGADSTGSVAAAMKAAGCTYRDTPGIKAASNHSNVTSAEMPAVFGGPLAGKGVVKGKIHYWTYPPANGPHYGVWAVWGFYTDPVPVVQVVHNEEHGGVILWWGSKVPQSEVDELHAFYSSHPESVFGTPAPDLGSKVAITAWTGDPAKYFHNGYYGTGHVAICPKFDDKAFAAFRDGFLGKGPEGVPTSANAPGSGPQG